LKAQAGAHEVRLALPGTRCSGISKTWNPYASQELKAGRQCNNVAVVMLDGQPYCKVHAGQVALRIVMEENKP
jgi:hypothetical protein